MPPERCEANGSEDSRQSHVPPLFEFRSVTLARQGATILDDLNVSIPSQGLTVIMGASGSGKSTMLRCCSLFETPTSGSIFFRGTRLDTVEPRTHRRRAAMVFQKPIVFAGTVAENLRAAEPCAAATVFKLRLSRSIAIAVGRSLLQMGIVSFALVLLIKPQTPIFWSWLWATLIVVFAAATVKRRTAGVPGIFTLSVIAHTVAGALGLATVFGFGIFDLSGRTLVPVSGMIIGGAMKASVVAADRVRASAVEHRLEIEARLALGASVPLASRRFTADALRTALSPQLQQIGGLGLVFLSGVFLPGAMTGMILAGASPLDAVLTQLTLMYVMFSSIIIAAVITGLGVLRCLTTPQQTLMYVPRR